MSSGVLKMRTKRDAISSMAAFDLMIDASFCCLNTSKSFHVFVVEKIDCIRLMVSGLSELMLHSPVEITFGIQPRR